MNLKPLILSTISILLTFCTIQPSHAQFGGLPIRNNPTEMVTAKTFPLTTQKQQLPNRQFNNYCRSELNSNPSVQFFEYTDRLEWTCKDELMQNTFTAQGQHIYYIPPIPGCTNPQSYNYNPNATQDDGTCQARVEGCMDSTAINYNPSANTHVESLCQYPPEGPTEITGFFDNSPIVQIGATTWTLRVKTNVENAFINISQIQLWEQFKVTEYTVDNTDIILTLKQYNDERLDGIECTSYELTIPSNAITAQSQRRTGTETIHNFSAITGNFSITGCPTSPNTENENPNNPNNQNEENENKKHENTIKEDNFYLSLYDTDENGKIYINLTNTVYFLGFIISFSIIFFVLFGFIKNSFLGKSRK